MTKNKFMTSPGGGGIPSPTGNYDPTPLISGLFGLGTQALSNRQQRKLEADRRKYDQAQWERVNRYNHPIEQMARLTSAGLNPNLIYGSSPGSAVGNAGAIAAGQAPEYKLDNPVTGYMNTKVQQAQTANLKSQSSLNIARSIESVNNAHLTKSQERRLNKLLAGDLEMQSQDIKIKTEQAYQALLQSKAIGNKEKGLIARYAAETEKSFADRDQSKYKADVEKLNSTLAKAGIRPNDSIYVRIMSQVTGIDLSKPLTKEQLKKLETFINNPFKRL